jgi:hypothetical protein
MADEFQEIRELIDRYTTLKTNKEVNKFQLNFLVLIFLLFQSLMEIQNQREEQLELLRRKREAFVQVSLILYIFSYLINFKFDYIEKE